MGRCFEASGSFGNAPIPLGAGHGDVVLGTAGFGSPCHRVLGCPGSARAAVSMPGSVPSSAK